jgi:Integrase/Phage integrase, N-terminal
MATAIRMVIKTYQEWRTHMHDLNFQLRQLCAKNRDGSFGTQAQRAKVLQLSADQLVGMGYRHLTVHTLKPKHVEALAKKWLDEGLSPGTCKNRMSALRWWAMKVNRQNVIAKSNAHYGIPDRHFVAEESKAKSLTNDALDKIKDSHVRMSLELQRAFGLRREEAIKFSPSYADRGDTLELKASWTKGGKARVIPIRTTEQREVLNRARQLAGMGALIPANRNYIQQLRLYEGQTLRAGLCGMHGLRHAYAQQRYHDLTGWLSPAAGGPPSDTFTAEQKAFDKSARLEISKELGHEREAITTVYLGR